MKKSLIFAGITVCIWSTLAAVAKTLLGRLPNLQTLALGSLFAFLFLEILNLFTGGLRKMRRIPAGDYLKMAGLGALGLFLYSALYYHGLSVLTSQEACILNYLWPMMIMLFSAPVLHEKLTALKLVSMLCSFGGVILMCIGGDGGFDGKWSGILACIAAAACYGLFSVLNKKADLDQNVSMTVIWLTVAALSFAIGPFVETWVPIEGTAWLGLLWLGVGVNAVAYLLWALALKEARNTAAVANIAYLTPFLSLIVSAVFLKEKIGWNAALAGGLIVGGILLPGVINGLRRRSA